MRLVPLLVFSIASAACAGSATTVRIPAGSFTMGTSDQRMSRILKTCREATNSADVCTEKRFAHEKPAHEVELAEYELDLVEVSNEKYAECVASGACTPQEFARCETFDLLGRTNAVPENHPLRKGSHPAVCVSYAQAEKYCASTGGRLPTEAEWERAARGTGDILYPWGDRWDPEVLNWGEDEAFGTIDGHVFSAPVGIYQEGKSPEGVLDMGGNVWEWTADWYAADAYEKSERKNPKGPATGEKRVTRGGGYVASPIAFMNSHRAPQDPARVTVNIGFRCARSIP